MAQAEAAPAPSSGRWLYNAPVDLLLGCGGLYILLFGAFLVFGASLREAMPAALLPAMLLGLSIPHYGATLLRVYEDPQERRRYVFFTVHTAVMLGLLFALAVHSPLVGSLVTTLYLSWSPWHYAGQNYGLALMFLHRGNVELPAKSKRLLYASFVLSFLIFLLVHHRAVPGRKTATDHLGSAIPNAVELQLGIPESITSWLIPAVIVAYAACLILGVLALIKVAANRQRALLPAGLLVLSQALWFAIPFGLEYFAPSLGIEILDQGSQLSHYILWVAMAHAIQYLWVTSYFARSTDTWRGQPRHYGKVLLAGTGIWAVPVLLFAPDLVGRVSIDADLGLAIVAVVNLHHFILDGAIWKLRNSRIGSVLIRGVAPEAASASAAGRRFGWGKAVWALCALGLLVECYSVVEGTLFYPKYRDQESWSQAAAVLDRMRWVGRDNADQRRTVARGLYQQGQLDEAVANYKRSIDLNPVANRAGELASLLESVRRTEDARVYYDKALSLEPNNVPVLMRSADFELRAMHPERAAARYQKILTLTPDNTRAKHMLEQALAATQRQTAL